MRVQKVAMVVILTVLFCQLGAAVCWGLDLNLPAVQFHMDDAQAPEQVAGVLKILFVLTVLSVAPSILVLMTSFTRLAVVFAFLRTALGTQQSPPNQVIVGLALFLTLSIMWPVWQQINEQALQPFQAQEISGEEFVQRAVTPLKHFMLKQTRTKDLKLFTSFTSDEKPKNAEALPLAALVPAFVISELKTAFQIGFLLYIPFLVLDMVVASILLSMGMMMLPPVMISLPFKLMLFVLVDGWNLLVASLVKSF
ncbi:flagellar biosynthetic protein FliP [Desulfacinum hydrothermale DSM 13146]|uniref:Flagellar biosynthetic protein FliP n=1 Tax=Desulfacinum hydrothermale DSM 13146 TaxID=1121390 RepID=A0A1W1X6J8_9BACT|nr:flagellar type III secretion system pore protein FliP [Desulfacinum hydrothermale]SMC19348.1 flagellar biosynthetic protein FliP [Desulfacinum hydrothermale DSM 13146]